VSWGWDGLSLGVLDSLGDHALVDRGVDNRGRLGWGSLLWHLRGVGGGDVDSLILGGAEL